MVGQQVLILSIGVRIPVSEQDNKHITYIKLKIMSVKLDFKETARRWKRYADEHKKEGRTHYYEFNKTILKLAVFLMGFNFIWLQITNEDSLTTLIKIIFGLSLFFLLLSIIFGLSLILSLNASLNRVGEDYENKSAKLYKYMLENNKDSDEKIPDHIPEIRNVNANPWQFYLLIIFFLLGFITSVLTGVIFLIIQ
jgi:hypothetical protein